MKEGHGLAVWQPNPCTTPSTPINLSLNDPQQIKKGEARRVLRLCGNNSPSPLLPPINEDPWRRETMENNDNLGECNVIWYGLFLLESGGIT